MAEEDALRFDDCSNTDTMLHPFVIYDSEKAIIYRADLREYRMRFTDIEAFKRMISSCLSIQCDSRTYSCPLKKCIAIMSVRIRAYGAKIGALNEQLARVRKNHRSLGNTSLRKMESSFLDIRNQKQRASEVSLTQETFLTRKLHQSIIQRHGEIFKSVRDVSPLSKRARLFRKSSDLKASLARKRATLQNLLSENETLCRNIADESSRQIPSILGVIREHAGLQALSREKRRLQRISGIDNYTIPLPLTY
jgi:hypothetical protein